MSEKKRTLTVSTRCDARTIAVLALNTPEASRSTLSSIANFWLEAVSERLITADESKNITTVERAVEVLSELGIPLKQLNSNTISGLRTQNIIAKERAAEMLKDMEVPERPDLSTAAQRAAKLLELTPLDDIGALKVD